LSLELGRPRLLDRVIAGVVLAAGLARRMGRRKLLLEIDGKPLIRWSVEGVLDHVQDALVVTGPDAGGIDRALAGLPVRFVTNPHPEDGQGTSIATGIRSLLPGTRAALIALGDQPWVPPGVLPALLEAFGHRGRPIVAALYRDVQGTPVLFGASVFSELAELTGDAGARSVVRRDPTRVELVSFDLPMPVDVDTAEDYARVRARPAVVTRGRVQ
jgi:molybdenum cofactor cytidylyltransferase